MGAGSLLVSFCVIAIYGMHPAPRRADEQENVDRGRRLETIGEFDRWRATILATWSTSLLLYASTRQKQTRRNRSTQMLIPLHETHPLPQTAAARSARAVPLLKRVFLSVD
jgi:hypothetical protein